MGKVTSIQDEGTIIIVWVDGVEPVYFDHRMFQNLYEDREGRILGCTISIEYEEGEQIVSFEEAAPLSLLTRGLLED